MTPQDVINKLSGFNPNDVGIWRKSTLASALGDWADPSIIKELNKTYSRVGVEELALFILCEAVYAGWTDDEIKQLHALIPPSSKGYDLFVFALTQNLRRDLLKHFSFEFEPPNTSRHYNELMIRALLGAVYHLNYHVRHPRFSNLYKKSYVTQVQLDNPAVVEAMLEELIAGMTGWQQMDQWITYEMTVSHPAMVALAVKVAAKVGKFSNPNHNDGIMLRRACSKSAWNLAEELIRAGAKTDYLGVSAFTKLKAALKRRKTDGLLAVTEVTPQHATELLKAFCVKHDSKLLALSRMGDLFKQVAELIDLGADLNQVCDPSSYRFRGLMLAAKGKEATGVENALVVHAVTTELER